LKHKLIAAVMLVLAALLMIAALAIVSFAEVAETQGFATALLHFPRWRRCRDFSSATRRRRCSC